MAQQRSKSEAISESRKEDINKTAKTVTMVDLHIYLNVVLYALAIHMVMPVYPYLLQSMGAGQVEHGNILSLTSFLQMVGAFLAGPFIDAFGSRSTVLVSYTAAAIGYLSLHSAKTPMEVYMSRMLVLFQQVVLASRTLVALQTGSDVRKLSYLSLAYGAGTTIGPSLSSFMIQYTGNIKIAPLASACVSLFSLSLAYLLTQDVTYAPKRKVSVSSIYKSLGIADLVLLSQKPQIRLLLIIKFMTAFASSMFHSGLSFKLSGTYQMKPQHVGYTFSYIGIIVVVSQLLFNRYLAHMNDKVLMRYSLLLMALALTSLNWTSSIAVFIISLVPLMAGATVLLSVSTSSLTKEVAEHQQGSVIGLDMSLVNSVRVVAPVLTSRIPQTYLVGTGVAWCAYAIAQYL